jgi:hypothetical protein
MSDWLTSMLRREPTGGVPSGPRIPDADAKQLAQLRAIMHDELESLEATTAHAPADLGIASTEHARTLRAQSRAGLTRMRKVR